MQNREDQAVLVADAAAFLQELQQRLNGQPPPNRSVASEARQRAEQLRARASALGMGGLVHHLAQCCELLGAPSLDVRRLREILRIIAEITWQLRQELKSPAGPSAPPPQMGAKSLAEPAQLEPPQ